MNAQPQFARALCAQEEDGGFAARRVTFGSMCSGIEAASVAFRPLGWEPAFFSEIESFPVEVLKYRHAACDLRQGRTPIVPVVVGGESNPTVSENGLYPPLTTRRGDRTAIAFTSKDYGADAQDDISPTLRAMGHKDSHANAGGQIAIAIQAGALRENPNSGPDGAGFSEDLGYTLEARAEVQAVAARSAVRRLTVRECERLQGFDDDYTLIPTNKRNWSRELDEMRDYFKRTNQDMTDDDIVRLAADGPRYKALGNSKAVPVVRWIGERIDAELKRAA
jgi:site-specific DNA-cytosine methylase